jgi:hypothetical protein
VAAKVTGSRRENLGVCPLGLLVASVRHLRDS